MEQYKDKPTEVQMELMRRYPSFLVLTSTHASWRVDAGALRRGTLKNARNPECKTSADGVGMYGCWSGTPFPISKKWPRSDAMLRAPQFHDLGLMPTTGYLANANGDNHLCRGPDPHLQRVSLQQSRCHALMRGPGSIYQRVHNIATLPARDPHADHAVAAARIRQG